MPPRKTRGRSQETIESNSKDSQAVVEEIEDITEIDHLASMRRRRSSRVTTRPNYEVTPKRRKLDKAESTAVTPSVDNINQTENQTQSEHIVKLNNLDELPSIFKKSNRNKQFEPKLPPKMFNKSKKEIIIKENLSELIISNNKLIDELHYLKNFISLPFFEPEKISRLTESYINFSSDYQLWPKDNTTTQSRRSRRVNNDTIDPYFNEINKLASETEKKRLDEALKQEEEEIQQEDQEDQEEVEQEEDSDVIEVKEKEIKESKQNNKDKKKTKQEKQEKVETKGKTRGRKPKKLEAPITIEDSNDEPKEDDDIIETAPPVKTYAKRGRKKKVVPEPKENISENEETQETEETLEEDLEEEEDSGMESDITDLLPSDYKLPKSIKLNINIEPQPITHPLHVAKKQFPDLKSYLDSFKATMEEPSRDLDQADYKIYLNDQNNFVSKIRNAIDNKLLRIDFNENIFRNVPAGTREPTMIKKNTILHQQLIKEPINPFRLKGQLTHNDHLMAQGMVSAKLLKDRRNNRIQKCRRIAQMVETYFKRLSKEEERQSKDTERKIIRLARETAKEVKKRWTVAVKAYKILEEREKERERAEKSKEQLSRILDHSTKVLGAQLTRRSESATATDDESRRRDGSMEPEADSDNGSNSDASEDLNMSTSEDESENEKPEEPLAKDGVSDDAKLTVDQLKEKYKDLDTASASNAEDEDDEVNADGEESDLEDVVPDEDDKNFSSGLSALYSGSGNGSGNGDATDVKPQGIVDQMTEDEVKQLMDNDKDKNPILDSDSDGDNDSLSSDVSDSDNDSEFESENEVSDNSQLSSVKQNGKTNPKPKSGLASLFGNGQMEADSDDESDYNSDTDKVGDGETDSSSVENNTKNESKQRQDSTEPGANDNDNDNTNGNTTEDDESSKIPDVPVPSLLRGTLRIYQKQGLNWLASLYNNGTNGILADEMGLGKTIQTISLISYLACEKNIWGPHLIVVPTSVMLNWEMEFKRFAPGFKVLTYYGSPQQRKEKRKGWNKPDTFHVCITSYQLVVHDQQIFRRKKWKYMILDEAHNIKNFRSQRWRSLLNFNTENRLLLTGTPLQNNIMELWSLLYFLMPSSRLNSQQLLPDGFANLTDFQQWFGRPVDKIIQSGGTSAMADEQTKKTVSKLHQVLRPYILRRLKADVEKQMPAKYEHIVYCRLSKRQRLLYDDFMSRAQTKETLASGNFLSIINCLMQLRKVCNHPDLFEVRPILTSFPLEKSVSSTFELKELVVRRNLRKDYENQVSLDLLNLLPVNNNDLSETDSASITKLSADKLFANECDKLNKLLSVPVKPNYSDLAGYFEYLKYRENEESLDLFKQRLYVNKLRCQRKPLFGPRLLNLLTIKDNKIGSDTLENFQLQRLGLVLNLNDRVEQMSDIIEKYSFVTPKVVSLDLNDRLIPSPVQKMLTNKLVENKIENPFHQSQVKLSIAFPDKSLLQYDCGKLQKLAVLLHDLTSQGHRALIFTQMTKVLDVLEKFLNIHGYKYMRLDGATKIEDRQLLTEKFNKDARIDCFILSTRSGGLGINLTGADTVIFYDSDWNPAMDKQCQDRCHRIGQTRDVHIYRFVSEYTIESNILKKANQKRQLDDVIIQEGDFTTDYFSKLSVKDLLGEPDDTVNGESGESGESVEAVSNGGGNSAANNDKLLFDNKSGGNLTSMLAQAEDADDAKAANLAMQEVEVDNADFDENAAKNNSSNGGGLTPFSESDQRDSSVDISNTNNNGSLVLSNSKSSNDNDDGERYYGDDDDEAGHIDEYMIRYIASGYYWD
ncbi:hypothetical protein B5S29_g2344 [[Candida] boidinii]|nr:hypothetical protein B5S29_g2344 [[Candida] boidinii]